MEDCLFCKIVSGEIPSEKIFEDEDFIVIKDISGKPAIHYLLIPKEHYKDLTELNVDRANKLGRGLLVLSRIAKDVLKMDKGFRIVNNMGEYGCQSVPHMHIHLIGGEQLEDKMG